jgi:hypothetical protein
MKQEWKEKWVAALRSGEYKRSYGCLKRGEEGYCCLGVLNTILPKPYQTPFCHSYLRYSTSKFVELSEDKQKQLANLNDTLGYSFNRIADWIERNL